MVHIYIRTAIYVSPWSFLIDATFVQSESNVGLHSDRHLHILICIMCYICICELRNTHNIYVSHKETFEANNRST
jgi:hypothetical protein